MRGSLGWSIPSRAHGETVPIRADSILHGALAIHLSAGTRSSHLGLIYSLNEWARTQLGGRSEE